MRKVSPDVPPNVGPALAAWRKASHLTQAQIAQAAGVDVSTVHNWERSRSQPLIGHIPRLAAAFQIPSLTLFASMIPQ